MKKKPLTTKIISLIFLSIITISINEQLNAQVKVPKKDTTSTSKGQHILQEVIVHGKAVIRQIKDSPLPVELVNLKSLQAQSGNLINTLRRIPGVNVRTDGGVGDPVNYSLNGLDNKAIVLFKDGIPMTFYGHAFDPSLVSVNMFDRIEVYKGALPLSLGADALGGGINFVSRHSRTRVIDASYEMASFNTHRAALHVYLPDSTRNIYGGSNLSYIFSDNNWKVDVGRDPVPGETYADTKGFFGSHIYDRSVQARLRNNGLSAYTAEAYIGVRKKSWADDLRLTLIASEYYRNLNRIPGATPMLRAASSRFAFGKDKTLSGLLSYKKKLLSDKLHIDVTAGYSQSRSMMIDTARWQLDRFGNIALYDHGSPGNLTSTGSNLRLKYTFYTVRFNAAYNITKQQQLQLSHVFSNNNRIGSDTLGGMAYSVHPDNFGQWVDVYSYPAQHRKYVSAIGLSSKFLNGKLENLIAVKHYKRHADGYTTYGRAGDQKIGSEQSTNWGWMEGVSYRPDDRWLFKASYEHATRLPDDYEVFGDSRGIRSNFGIKPERSHNVNAQFQYSSSNTDAGAWMIASNLFYRKTHNMIMLLLDLPFSYHANYYDMNIKGVELDFYYRPFRFCSFGGNAMYMDRRIDDTRVWDKSPILANLNARVHKEDLFQKGSRTELYWYWSYAHRYTISPGHTTTVGMFEKMTKQNSAGTIESWMPLSGEFGQAVHTLGLVHYLSKPKVSIALECHNLTNNVIYDNFLNQSPGRSFAVKLRWQLGDKE